MLSGAKFQTDFTVMLRTKTKLFPFYSHYTSSIADFHVQFALINRRLNGQ